ncbi:hypothetical protein R1sor_018507 [Riccia sorocarpa]|uniref:Uncharacterized protein n=1 Tax=Riccia sorocarpa TaxID=122646 RepID=A0ABD3I9V9_9MARC
MTFSYGNLFPVRITGISFGSGTHHVYSLVDKGHGILGSAAKLESVESEDMFQTEKSHVQLGEKSYKKLIRSALYEQEEKSKTFRTGDELSVKLVM